MESLLKFKVSKDFIANTYVTCFCTSSSSHLNGLIPEDSIYELLMGETFRP